MARQAIAVIPMILFITVLIFNTANLKVYGIFANKLTQLTGTYFFESINKIRVCRNFYMMENSITIQ